MEAQQEVVARFLNGGDGSLVGEFVEIESGRKDSKNRPQLVAALAACKERGATLIIAKLDRLARNVRFFLEVLDDSGVDIRFAEFADINPKTDEGRMVLTNMATFAEYEGRRIGSRTKAAIAAKKARVESGTDKGGQTVWSEAWGVAGLANLKRNIAERQAVANAHADKLAPTIAAYRAASMSQRVMVQTLNDCGARTANGGRWSLMQLQRVITRLKATSPARQR
ncbi:MAG: recombinase family protein [Rhodoferax sp.]|nr:recombinase family protein [Rhodoferax sp.]